MASSRHPSDYKNDEARTPHAQDEARKPRREQVKEARREGRDKDAELDAALRDSFPASDPPAISQPTTSTPSLADRDETGAGDRTRRKLQDRVNVADRHELDYWTDRFGVSAAELKAAVREVGFFPQDVAHRLNKPL